MRKQKCWFWPGVTQTRLYSYWRLLEAWNFGFRKKRNCTIQVAKTKALISFADLRVYFRICKTLVFPAWRGSYCKWGYRGVQVWLALPGSTASIVSRTLGGLNDKNPMVAAAILEDWSAEILSMCWVGDASFVLFFSRIHGWIYKTYTCICKIKLKIV